MKISDAQLELVDRQVKRILKSNNYYSGVYKKAGITGINSEEDFYRMISVSFKVPAERWLLARRIIQDYDRLHGDHVNDSEESKLSAWWTERLKTRISDDKMRMEICNHLVMMNLHSLKYDRQYEEPLKGKLQEQWKEKQ